MWCEVNRELVCAVLSLEEAHVHCVNADIMEKLIERFVNVE